MSHLVQDVIKNTIFLGLSLDGISSTQRQTNITQLVCLSALVVSKYLRSQRINFLHIWGGLFGRKLGIIIIYFRKCAQLALHYKKKQ